MNNFPDLATALAFTATLPVGTFSISQDLDGSATVITGLIPASTVPQVITSFQAKAALSQAGLYSKVNTYMTTTAPELQQIAWAEASTFDRNDSFIAALAPALGLTDSQVDQLFIVGVTLQA